MFSAAGRALLARAALAAPSSGAYTPVLSSSASLFGRWQQRGGLASASTEAPPLPSGASSGEEASAAAAAPEQQQPEASTSGNSGDQQQQQPQATEAATSAAATSAAATSTSGAQVGARLVQPVPGGGGGGIGGGIGGDRGRDRNRPPGRSLTGTVHVASTPNNTLMTLLSREGLVKTLVTGGSVGFRNSAKGTPQAAERAAAELARRALAMGISSVAVRFRGTGRNKQFALSALAAGGLSVTSLEDVTAVAYNGCRLPRRRRV